MKTEIFENYESFQKTEDITKIVLIVAFMITIFCEVPALLLKSKESVKPGLSAPQKAEAIDPRIAELMKDTTHLYRVLTVEQWITDAQLMNIITKNKLKIKRK